MTRFKVELVPLAIMLVGCAPRREVIVERPPPRREVVVVERPREPGWVMLGERAVDGNYDHDVIPVGGAEGRFNKLMFSVEHHAVEIFDVSVLFGDGSRYDVPTRLVFRPDSRSRVIDLPGSDRVIRRIDFKYGNVPGRGRAHVEVWAR